MHPHFIGQCDLTPLKGGDGGDLWRLKDAFAFWSPRCGIITVRAGFVTDLASIPRCFWSIIAPFAIAQEAVVHDWLYRTQHTSRDEADLILWEAMTIMRRKWLLKHIVYFFVRAFGEAAWLDDSRHLSK